MPGNMLVNTAIIRPPHKMLRLTLDDVERSPVLALGVLVRLHRSITLDVDQCPDGTTQLVYQIPERRNLRHQPFYTHPFCRFWM